MPTAAEASRVVLHLDMDAFFSQASCGVTICCGNVSPQLMEIETAHGGEQRLRIMLHMLTD